jgi:hypothetical protein
VIDTLDLDCHAVPYGQVGETPSLVSPASNYQAPDLRPAFHWTWSFPGIDPTHIAYGEVCLTTEAEQEAGGFCDVGAIPSTTATDLVPEADLPVSGTVHWTARGCNLVGDCGPWQSQARWLILPGDEPTPPPGPELPTATFEADLYPVYAHPRCTNCHGGYNPFGFQQGDSVLHPGFAPNNEGNAELCANCHQIDDGEWQTWKDPDDDPGQIPLFAIWQADFGGTGAPARDADDICATVRSEVINHQWDAEAFHEHVEDDPLIGWSFEPEGNMDDATEGEAASDVMPRADWVAISMGWFEAGMPCVGEAGEVFAYEPAVGSTGFSASLAALLELMAGSRATQYLKLGAVLPKDVREPKPRPRPDPFPRTKSAKRPAQKDWVINPVKGTLTKERVELLERAGLHPRFAPFEEVRKVLAPTARQ